MTPKFSDRMGITKPPTLQLRSIDDALRNSIWNVLAKLLFPSAWQRAAITIGVDLLKIAIDDIRAYSDDSARLWLYNKYFGSKEWYEPYNMLQFVVENIQYLRGGALSREHAITEANQVLERELSAYRFVGTELVPITSEAEMRAIEEAMAQSLKTRMSGVEEHLRSALAMLGKKPEPDYRNSIKESISAVESAVKLITGTRGGGLDDAMNVLAAKTGMHGALKSGLSKLYGYTSDASGIRHAMLEESTVDYDDAKFMLVSCSAFVNFLIAKADAAGLLARR